MNKRTFNFLLNKFNPLGKVQKTFFSTKTNNFFKTVRPRNFKPLILFTASAFFGLSYQYNQFSFPTYMIDKQNTQSTVTTGNHEQCSVVVIHLDQNFKQNKRKDLFKACNNLQQIVNRLSPTSSQTNVEEDLPELMAGIGFQTDFWDQISNQKTQNHFTPKVGKYGDMPKGEGDIILHVKGKTKSLCFQVVQEFVNSLPAGSVTKVVDNFGWQYREGRDLSGFIDGTMNPAVFNQRQQAGVQDNGGSFMIHQIWKHNLGALNQVPVQKQEAWVGRKKDNSQELKDLPVDSHVARTRDDKKQRILIVRQSMPFGTVGNDHGLLFIAYSNSTQKFDTMLDRMTGKPDGVNDAIMQFSKCVYSNYFFFPPVQEISKQAK